MAISILINAGKGVRITSSTMAKENRKQWYLIVLLAVPVLVLISSTIFIILIIMMRKGPRTSAELKDYPNYPVVTLSLS